MVRSKTRYSSALRTAFGIFLAAAVVGGCGSTIGRLPGIGVPVEAPPPPEKTADYPAVGDSGVKRQRKAFTTEERAKQEAELARLRGEAAAKKRQEIEKSAPR